jgi:anti-anti-sigma factor
MSIKQQQIGKLHHIRVSGRVDQSQTPQLEASLAHLLGAGHKFLIVDLSHANYINSGGLRCLVSAWRKAHLQDGDLILCGLTDRLQEIFGMIGFDNVFQIFSDFETAQKAISQDSL